MSTDVSRDDAAPAPLPWWPLLPWQRASAAALLSRREAFPHALLIVGPRGIGKHALALNLAQGLLCESPVVDGLACGRCAGCRYAEGGTHPDLLRLELSTFDHETQERKATETIAIDRVRALIDFVQLSSHRQRAKVAVIAPAERMNANAANALLKTLEEPPAGTFLLLVAEAPGRLPATVVSRCRRLPGPQPTPDEARAWLAGHGVPDGALALSLAGGAPLLALVHAEPSRLAERALWLEALSRPEARSGAIPIAHRRSPRSARGWRPVPCLAIIAGSRASARCSPIRCSRGWWPKRCLSSTLLFSTEDG